LDDILNIKQKNKDATEFKTTDGSKNKRKKEKIKVMLNPKGLDKMLDFKEEESPPKPELYQSEKQNFKKRYLNPSTDEYPGTSVKKHR
jgi:hypothetical protein